MVRISNLFSQAQLPELKGDAAEQRVIVPEAGLMTTEECG